MFLRKGKRFFNIKNSQGFTLMELLVVVAIIGILSTVVFASVNTAREKAKISKTVSQIKEIRNGIALYVADVGVPPAVDCVHNTCNAGNDPMLNALGASGWSGPYTPSFYDLRHPWGGQISWSQSIDWNMDGNIDRGIILNDDEPGTPINNNQGLIPTDALQRIDELLDDGDLTTGNVFGDIAGGANCVTGEACIIFIDYANN